MPSKERTWNFCVVGCDSNNVPKYLGFFETDKEATRFQRDMEAIGWQRVTIFDAELKEVADEKRRGAV